MIKNYTSTPDNYRAQPQHPQPQPQPQPKDTSSINLSYGLNARHHKNKCKKGLTGFDGSDNSHSNNDDNVQNTSRAARPASARSAVNQDIALDQAAVRKRAQTQTVLAALPMRLAVYD